MDRPGGRAAAAGGRGEGGGVALSVPVGISRCLLGEAVRHDAGHARWRDDGLAAHLRFVPVCPEVEAGMGIPREAVRLVRIDDGPVRMVGRQSGTDWTQAMADVAAARIPALRAAGIRGFILKSQSPSCGMERVKTYRENGYGHKDGAGLFAAALMEAWPELPVEEEGRLLDAGLRQAFAARLFVYHAWRTFREGSPTVAGLMDFHGRHKMLLMAHDPAQARALGRLVAGSLPLPERLAAYEPGLMATLARRATRGRHVNVMEHLAGFASDQLDPQDKVELAGVIDAFRQGHVPLEVPLTLLRHHLRRTGEPWALAQVYLQPFPAELGLRSAIIA
ncbi:MAG: DUF523 and DUF1722 domain-containing protein [bacterium]